MACKRVHDRRSLQNPQKKNTKTQRSYIVISKDDVVSPFIILLHQGGLIQQFLSHRAWVPPARLSFGAYLLHPLVINLWVLNSRAKVCAGFCKRVG